MIPGILIIALGLLWIFKGEPLAIGVSFRDWIPDLSNRNNIVFFNGILLGLAGMEMSAVHAEEVKNPQKNYPRAILLSTLIILILSILGSLAIAIVIPQSQIELVEGVMQTFYAFFRAYRMEWMTPVIALLTTIGALAMVSTWIIGPTKGLLATANHGDLPPWFGKMDEKGVPISILFLQGIIVTALSLIFLFMPTVSSSYWILSVLTVQIYLIMYILMFAASIKLRYSKPEVARSYRVPGGNYGMWTICGIGTLGSLFAIAAGFIPPEIYTGSLFFYEAFLLAGIGILCAAPLLIAHYKKPSWQRHIKEGENGDEP